LIEIFIIFFLWNVHQLDQSCLSGHYIIELHQFSYLSRQSKKNTDLWIKEHCDFDLNPISFPIHLHLRNRLLVQGYTKIRLIRSLKKFIFRYQDLVEIYSVSAEKIINDEFSYSENVYRKGVNKNVKNIFLSMCDVKVSLTFTSLSLMLLWQLFYLFCSSIVVNTVIVTAGDFEP
jgi:hypothetical protein